MSLDDLNTLGAFIKEVGLPVTLVIVNTAAIFLCAKWVAPRLEKWVQSWIDAESKNAATLRELASKTMQLSEANARVLTEMSSSLTRLVDQCVYCRENRDLLPKRRTRKPKG